MKGNSSAMEATVIKDAESKEEIEQVRMLFVEYAKSLSFPLDFQGFEKELSHLPYEYVPPGGALLLATLQGRPAGCVALRMIDSETCEMKRLYLRDKFRGLGLGKRLAVSTLEKASNLGYKRMRLDTIPSMDQAISLYRQLGFQEIEPYRHNPVPGALFMELNLQN